MIFTELEKEEFRTFLDSHELKSYLQTPEIAALKVSNGWSEYYVGVKENNKILCATMMVSYNGRFGKFFSAPRGFLIDFRNIELLRFFTINIKKYIREKGGYVLNIEPKILYKERDINGNLVENGFDNSDIYNNLISLGYKHNGFYLELDLNKQVRWAFVLELKNKSEDEVFKNFKPNTRNIIRKAIKYGVSTRELSYDELDKFRVLVESSGERKNFHSRSTEYYQKMYNLFHEKEEVKFLVSEINLDDYIDILSNEKKELNEKIAKIKDHMTSKNQKDELLTQITSLDVKIEEAKNLKAKYGSKPIMAGGMFMLYGKEIVYLYSGTNSDFMTLQSQFLIQWDMIKYGINNGYEIYNFYGINGRFTKDDNRYGVYTFKKGFGGNVIEYIGDFDLIINPLKYFFHKIISKMK